MDAAGPWNELHYEFEKGAEASLAGPSVLYMLERGMKTVGDFSVNDPADEPANEEERKERIITL